MNKHLTASVFVLRRDQNQWKIALVFHKQYQKWMLPGGHVEPTENPFEAAIRETKEETGLDIQIQPVFSTEKRPLTPTATQVPLPEFILEEQIPATTHQPEHYHIDFLYAGITQQKELQLQPSESTQINWFTKNELETIEMFTGIKQLAQAILEKLEH